MNKLSSFMNRAFLCFIIVVLPIMMSCKGPSDNGVGSSSRQNPTGFRNTIIYVDPNSNNPYDSIGRIHNDAMCYAFDNVPALTSIPSKSDRSLYLNKVADTAKAYMKSRYSLSTAQGDSARSWERAYLVAHHADTYSYNDTLTKGLTSKEQLYWHRMTLALSPTNTAHLLDSIVVLETAITAESWADTETVCLKAIAIARYSYYFWSSSYGTNIRHYLGDIGVADALGMDWQIINTTATIVFLGVAITVPVVIFVAVLGSILLSADDAY